MDVDGSDFCIKFPGRTPTSFSSRIDVQVKTDSRPRHRDGTLIFRGLTAQQFIRLAGDDHVVPRYLFVILVPSRAEDYVDVSTSGLLLRHLGYFISLQNRQRLDSTDPDRRIVVQIPLANVLTVETLRRLTIGGSMAGGSGARIAVDR